MIASASFSGGACQLRLVSAEQEPSPEGRKRFNVGLRFQFETLPRKADGSTPPLPNAFYLNNDKSPLVAAHVVAGKNLAKTPHTGSAEGNDGVVVINGLEVGDVRQRLQNVEIELALVHVIEWDPQTFEVAAGSGDFLKCGPFELRTFADQKQLRVDAMAYPQFRADHEAFRVKMPLAFLDSGYAMRELKLVDAAGRSPAATATTTPGGGAVSSIYTSWRSNDANAEAQTANDTITYPVALSVRMPKRYETERIKFRFPEIRLPAPPAAAR